MHSVTDNNAFNADFTAFRISDEATKAGDDNTTYYGYVNKSGDFYIMQMVRGTPTTYRYIRGTSGYTTAWASREILDYEYFYNVFNTL